MFRQPKRRADGQTDASNVHRLHTVQSSGQPRMHTGEQRTIFKLWKRQNQTHTHTTRLSLSHCLCLFLHKPVYAGVIFKTWSTLLPHSSPFLIYFPHHSLSHLSNTPTHTSHPDFFSPSPQQPSLIFNFA